MPRNSDSRRTRTAHDRARSPPFGLGTKALARNVAAIRKPPKVEQEEIQILTADEVAAVLGGLAGHALHPIASLALASGMRRGELLALEWSDIDLDRGVLRVERSVEETKAGLRLKPPKTKRGRRNITLPPET